MGIGVGMFLFAVGAILTFAVNVTTSEVNLETVGVILMLVGATGMALSMIYWNSWGGFSGARRTQEHIHRF